MITIQEIRPPRKVSGISSLLLKFDYNEVIINTVKALGCSVQHKTDQTQEVPINQLSKLLDELTFIDDIQLSLLSEPEIKEISESQDLTEEEISKFKIRPFNHQIEAINYGLNKTKQLNFSSMGLGKTNEGIQLAEALHRRGLIEHCLIILGVDSLRQNQKSEIKKFSNESVLVLGEKITKSGKITYETLPKRAEQLKNPINEFFVITNITNVGDDKFVEAFKKSKNKFGLIIFDEAHRATKHSQRGNNLLKLDAPYKVAMTGTPLVNSPLSAYFCLSQTDNDKSTLTNFKSLYCNFGGFNNAQITGYKNLELLKEELDSCSLRRTFDQVRGDMPTKTIDYELVEMSDEHRKFYEAIKAGVKEEADKIELKSNNLLALTTRLRQATAAPSVLTSARIDSSKVDRAVELAEDILDQGDKVVIFSTFVEPCSVLAEKLAKYKPLLGTGAQSDDLVSKNIDLFRNSENFNLLICTHAKCGTGYSMPECHYGIFIDQPYTYAQFSQSVDRIYRITSDQPIFIKVLTCADSIDERVRQIVETKKDLSDYMIDNKTNALSESLAAELRSIILDL